MMGGYFGGSFYWPLPPRKPLIDFLNDLYWRKWLRLAVLGNYVTRPGIWPIWLVRKTVKSITAPGRSRRGGRRK